MIKQRLTTLAALCLPLTGWAAAPALISPDTGTNHPNATRPSVPAFVPRKGLQLPQPSEPVPTQPAQAEPAATLLIKAFSFKGNHVFTDAELQAIAAPYRNRAVTAAELEQLRHQLSKHYSDHGYINSGALLSSQSFQNGQLQFDIIEGQLAEIRITGTGHLHDDYVRNRLMLGASAALNSQDLQERFQLLLQDPLIERMNGRLSPGLKQGQSRLDLEVTRARPYQLWLSGDNYRPPSTGALQTHLGGYVHNLTGYGERWDASVGLSEGGFDASGGFSMPINRYDTEVFVRGGFNRASIVEEPLEDVDIDNEFWYASVGINHPFYRSLKRSFYAGMKLDVRKSQTELDGDCFSFQEGEVCGTSKVTVLRFNQDFTDRTDDQVLSARSIFNVGINAFNATKHDGNKADGDFFAWLGQVQLARKIMDNGTYIQFRTDVQLSADRLLPLEQFALGGVHSVRGYRQNELVRDQGFATSLELHYLLFSKNAEHRFPGQLDLIPFMDYGGSWNVGDDDIERLHSVGVGLHWMPIPQISAEIYYAHDLNTARNKPEYDLQDSGLFFSVQLFAF